LSKAEHKKLAETAEVARKRSIDAEISSKSSVTDEGSTSSAKQLMRTTMCSKKQKGEVDEAVARMCYSTGVSFNVVNNKHFREMCHKIGEYGSCYQIRSDHFIRTTLLEKEYSKVSQEKINNFVGITNQQRKDLYLRFVNRWALLHTDLHAAGFLLDPEYVHMAQHSNEEVMNGFYRLVEKL
jgi:hypothetical protein